MSDLNKVLLIGTVKTTPERDLTGITSFTVRTAFANGESDDHAIVAAGAVGDRCLSGLAVGKTVYVEGKLHAGAIVASHCHFLGA